MKLLLFGGTFDPPHNGHVHLLQNAIAAVRPDRVVVMPAGTPPHKAASATPARWRLEMCRCFLPLHENLVVSDWEIKRAGKSYWPCCGGNTRMQSCFCAWAATC